MDAAGREMQVRTFVEEVWNGKNYAAISDQYAENYANPFGTGPAARAEPIRHYHQAFPDLRFEIEELIVAADTVVLRATFRGTDTGGYAGRAATGRGGRVGGHHHALRRRQGRPGMGRCRHAWAVHPARGRRQPVARLPAKSPWQIKYPAAQGVPAEA
jgi:SnoaL-like polyketide cyclase